ncbi:MAG TPA: N-ethylammeline chlorohydrolase, partial [Citreicella sp.]|nr:N-ethylammeline chlorohydrolase [Citreicella sp.]
MASHLRNITLLDPDSGMTRGVDLVTDTQGRIARIGPDLPPAPGVPVIDAQGALCLPGFVNSHNHSPLMIVRGMIEDISFAPAYTPGVPQGHWLSDEETLALA